MRAIVALLFGRGSSRAVIDDGSPYVVTGYVVTGYVKTSPG